MFSYRLRNTAKSKGSSPANSQSFTVKRTYRHFHIFSVFSKTQLRARNSTSVSQPVNWSILLWLEIFLLHETRGTTCDELERDLDAGPQAPPAVRFENEQAILTSVRT